MTNHWSQVSKTPDLYIVDYIEYSKTSNYTLYGYLAGCPAQHSCGCLSGINENTLFRYKIFN